MKYTWHEDKAEQVRREHGVAFAQITNVFEDPFALEFVDEAHSTTDETRYAIIGLALPGLVFAVFTTPTDEEIHFITARLAENMMTTDEDTELTTSPEARAAGLRRIPRRHRAEPGAVTLADCKVRVTLELDADLLEHFKARAAQPDTPAYQTQINQTLRAAVEREQFRALLENEEFLQ